VGEASEAESSLIETLSGIFNLQAQKALLLSEPEIYWCTQGEDSPSPLSRKNIVAKSEARERAEKGGKSMHCVMFLFFAQHFYKTS